MQDARACLDAGSVIAYPTEAVYGLGCDPWNTSALEYLLKIKGRPQHKGLIVLIADWSQLWPFIDTVPDDKFAHVRDSWPGPVTWVFPKASGVSALLSGDHGTIAIRMSAHKLAHELCCQGPIVSTSANITSASPAKSISELRTQFSGNLEFVLAGELGSELAPSAIYDVLTGERLR